MAKGTLKLNKMQQKKVRKFLVIYLCGMESKEMLVYGDEIMHSDELVEIYKGDYLVSVINDYVLVSEVIEEKTPE